MFEKVCFLLLLFGLVFFRRAAAQEPIALTLALLDESADGSLSLVGTAPPDSIVAITANRHIIRMTTADTTGEWSANVTIVDAGVYALRANLLDDTGTVFAISFSTPYTKGAPESDEPVDFAPCPTYAQAGTYLIGDRYRIGICDTLLQVGGRFGLQLAEILAVNSAIENPSFVGAGQIINLPPLMPYTFEVTAIRSINEQHITLLLRYELRDDLVEEAVITYTLPDTLRIVLDSSLPRPSLQVDGVLEWRLQPFSTPRGVIVLELDVVDGANFQQFSAELALTIRDQAALLTIRQQSPLGGLTATQATSTAEIPTQPAATPSTVEIPTVAANLPTQPAVARIVPRSERVQLEVPDDFDWATPANLSQSGSADAPVLLADARGDLHAFWNDLYAGMVYTRQDGDDIWTEPISIPLILNVETAIFQIDATNTLHAVWTDANRRLFYRRVALANINDAGAWQMAKLLANVADGIAFVPDADGHFHLTYIGMDSATDQIAKVQYRQLAEDDWTTPVEIFQSPYLRNLIGTTANTQVVAVAEQIFVAWDATNLEKIVLAGSTDFGKSWSESITVDQRNPNDNPNAQSPRGVRLAKSADSVIAVWYAGHDALNCALYYQTISNETAPVGHTPISDDLVLCPDDVVITTLPNDGLALIAGTESYTYLSTWRNDAWDRPRLQTALTSFSDDERAREVNLGCFSATTTDNYLYLLSCDNAAGSDIWLTRRSNETALTEPVALEPPATLAPTTTAETTAIAVVPTTEPGEFAADFSVPQQQSTSYGRTIAIIVALIVGGVSFTGYGVYTLLREPVQE